MAEESRHTYHTALPAEPAIDAADYQSVARALQYLEKEYRAQPNLDEVAAYVGLSPAHFQRLFRRWAGISPKRFVQYLTLDYAKAQLAASQSVLDAAYAAGLSSPGRLHDLFVNVEAVTPGEFKLHGAGVEIAYGFHATPFGECLLAATPRGICALNFVDDGRAAAVEALAAAWPAATLRADAGVTQPLADTIFPTDTTTGRRRVTLLLAGTNFQLKVWEALLRIPPGRMSTYGEIARHLGSPGAARTVGNAVGANPIAYLIPCHRVIRQTGAVGDYRWGSTRKRALIGWEAARVDGVAATPAALPA